MPRIKTPEESSKVAMVDEANVPKHPLLLYGDVKLKLGHQIARGGFSTVYKATDDFDNPLVVKVFNEDAHPLMWRNEVTNYQVLPHPLIVHMYGAFELEGQRYILLEDGGISVGRVNLSDSYERALIFILAAKGMLEPLHFMHKKGFVHTDINPANALLKLTPDQKPISVKLCDLGLSVVESALVPGKHKAKWNPPPETIDPARFGVESQKMDIYSTALVLMELINGQELGRFSEEEICDAEPQRMAREHVSPVARELVAALEPVAAKRPNALAMWKAIRKTGYAELKRIRP
jgi:serine/threonine protein kinase